MYINKISSATSIRNYSKTNVNQSKSNSVNFQKLQAGHALRRLVFPMILMFTPAVLNAQTTSNTQTTSNEQTIQSQSERTVTTGVNGKTLTESTYRDNGKGEYFYRFTRHLFSPDGKKEIGYIQWVNTNGDEFANQRLTNLNGVTTSESAEIEESLDVGMWRSDFEATMKFVQFDLNGLNEEELAKRGFKKQVSTSATDSLVCYKNEKTNETATYNLDNKKLHKYTRKGISHRLESKEVEYPEYNKRIVFNYTKNSDGTYTLQKVTEYACPTMYEVARSPEEVQEEQERRLREQELDNWLEQYNKTYGK